MNSEFIDRIELVRTHNNKNWMDILRLAIKYAPKKEIDIILENIVRHDEEVVKMMKRILEKQGE